MIERPAGAHLGRSFRFMRDAKAPPMTTVQKTLLLILAAAMALPVSLAAQTITVTVAGTDPNNWDVGSFGPGDVALPGNDFTNSVQPVAPSQQLVTINTTSPGASARVVSIRKNADEGTTWNSTYTLWIRRVSDGTGTGSITWVSTGWVQITSTATNLFTVRRDRTGITVELQMQSLLVAAGTTTSSPSFQTTLTYTIN